MKCPECEFPKEPFPTPCHGLGCKTGRIEELEAALRPFAERVIQMGMPRAKIDKDDLWVSIGFAQSIWLNAAKTLAK